MFVRWPHVTGVQIQNFQMNKQARIFMAMQVNLFGVCSRTQRQNYNFLLNLWISVRQYITDKTYFLAKIRGWDPQDHRLT